jgi:hypothetical protein
LARFGLDLRRDGAAGTAVARVAAAAARPALMAARVERGGGLRLTTDPADLRRRCAVRWGLDLRR